MRFNKPSLGTYVSGIKNLRKTNYQKPNLLKLKDLMSLLIVQNKVKNSFLKKNLMTIFFILGVSKTINSHTFFKLELIYLLPLFVNTHVLLIFKKFKRYATFFGGLSKLLEFVLVSFITLITKDLTFFRVWLVKKFESVFYRKHKKLLYLIKLFFVNYLFVYLNFFKCKGFFFKIRGKIGVGGNSKKKKYSIRLGRHSLTEKRLKFTNQSGGIRTLVGTLGFNLVLFYN